MPNAGMAGAYEAMLKARKTTHTPSCKVQIPDDSFTGWSYCGKPSTHEGTVLDQPVCPECLAVIR